MAGLEASVMEPKNATIRLTGNARRLAGIAAGYTGESIAEYVDRIVIERAQADIEEKHADFAKEMAALEEAAKPKRKPKGSEP